MAGPVDDRRLVQLIAVLAVVAVGLSAATLTTVQTTGGDVPSFAPPGYEGPSVDGTPGDGGPGIDIGDGDRMEWGFSLQFCVGFLNSAAGALLVFAGFVGAVGAIYRRYNVPLALLSGWILLSPTLLFYFLFTNCATGGQMNGFGDPTEPIPDPGETLFTVGQVPEWALAALVGGVLLGAVGLLVRSVGSDEAPVVEDGAAEDDPGLDEFAAAARRAADRIERHDAPVDNAVYRAWVEMTGLLDVERPEVYTPGEFADAAIRLGMAEDDVDELTRLFEEVRYGGRAPEDREERAVAVLDRIAGEYGPVPDADSDPDRGSGAPGESHDDC